MRTMVDSSQVQLTRDGRTLAVAEPDDVSLVLVAPSLHGEVARLYGILGNDPGRAPVNKRLDRASSVIG